MLLTLSVLSAHPTAAQIRPTHAGCQPETLRKADRALEGLDIPRALGYIHNCNDIRPELMAVYEQHAAFLQCFVHQGAEDFVRFQAAARTSDRVLDDQSPEMRAYLAGSHLERALVELFQRHYLAATTYLLRSYRLASSQSSPASHAYGRRIAAVYEMGLSSLPIRYKWILQLLGYAGDLRKGYALLSLSDPEGTPFPMEREIILFYMEKQVLNQPEVAERRIERLASAEPAQALPLYLWASFQLEQRRAARVLARLAPLLQSPEGSELAARLPYLWHTLGRAQLYAGEYTAAAQSLRRFLQLHRGTLLHADARTKIGLALQLAGQRPAALAAYQQALDLPHAGYDQDVRAQREARHQRDHLPSAAEQDLLQARFGYDGGYFAAALRALDRVNPQLAKLTPDQRTELYYRYGKIYQAQGQPSLARGYFQLVLRQRPYLHLWMQPYAEYALGEMDEKQGDTAQALTRYRAILLQTDYDYRNALEQKLKAAVIRLSPPSPGTETSP